MKLSKQVLFVNRILIGFLFFYAGITKAFISTPSGVNGFFNNLGIPVAYFFVWIVMLSEIIFGLSVIFRYKLKYTVYPLMLIIIVAALLVQWGNWNAFLMHFIIATNLFWYGINDLKM